MDISITQSELIKAYNYFKSVLNVHWRITDIDNINHDTLYCYMSENRVKYITRITRTPAIVKVRHLAIINDGSLDIINERNWLTFTTIRFAELLSDGIYIEELDKNYVEAEPIEIEPYVRETESPREERSYPSTNRDRVINSIRQTLFPTANHTQIESHVQQPNVSTTAIDEEMDDTKSYVDDLTCSICMTNKKQMCLTCGHMFCVLCSSKLTGKCFICKKTYTKIVKTFL
jgi:hypothetical protein